jgi:uncharacterized protein YceK
MRLRSILLLAILAGFTGCGTFTGKLAPYEGVKASVENCEWAPDAAEGLFWLGDIPLSAAADTLMLPVTVALAIREKPAAPPEKPAVITPAPVVTQPAPPPRTEWPNTLEEPVSKDHPTTMEKPQAPQTPPQTEPETRGN